MTKITPMLEQYYRFKEMHKDAILFFRVGDFYETFFDDAKITSRELDIVLTSRGSEPDNRYPLAGVPYHAAENYINRLVEKGYKVAVCEQVQDPKEAEGLVERDIVRIVTPGTILNENFLDEKNNNYIACAAFVGSSSAFAYADISTGELRIISKEAQDDCVEKVFESIQIIRPSEILIGNLQLKGMLQKFLPSILIYDISNEDAIANKDYAGSFIDRFAAAEAKRAAFTKDSFEAIAKAVAELMEYMESTQKAALNHFLNFVIEDENLCLGMDDSTIRNLELVRNLNDGSRKCTLLSILDHTKTAMGGRKLKNWIARPLYNEAMIRERHEIVECFITDRGFLADIRNCLIEIRDIERIMTRISVGNANPRDIKALQFSLTAIANMKACCLAKKTPQLVGKVNAIDELPALRKIIVDALVDEPPALTRDGGIIKDGVSIELDQLRGASRNGKQWIASYEAKEKEKSGIKSLKVSYNKVFGYYIEITNANKDSVPEEYIRKQTLANAERYITPELKHYEEMVLGAEERIRLLEQNLFDGLRKECAEFIAIMQNNAAIVSDVDVLLSFAEAALKNNYVKPEIDAGKEIIIEQGRHPVVEKMMHDEMFVPNDTLLNEKQRMLLITGPNMAGKSTFMRQTALIIIMCQTGSFVPAKTARIGLVDKLFARVGASDDLSSGRSTFMVEMNEVANIVGFATDQSLIILDEVGRGTSTYDGISIAWAVAEYIADKKRIGARTLFATHYHELTELENLVEGVVNYSTAIKEHDNTIAFLRRIVKGKTDRSYGIHVAKIAGLPNEIITRAYGIMDDLQKKDSSETKKKVRKSEKQPLDEQLSFVINQDSPLMSELKMIDIMSTTPLDALNWIFKWQKAFAGRDDDLPNGQN